VGIELGARVGATIGERAKEGATIGVLVGTLVGAFGAAFVEDIIGARTGSLGTGIEPSVVGTTSTGTTTLVGVEAGFGIDDTTGARVGVPSGVLMVGSVPLGATVGGGMGALSTRVKETR
jgi:hypothetical protein